ncbi:hypothetical protein [Novosphingobium sp. TH158]|uniref:hypothetical protein n=1 Tax=Novosphingobium sp. TH158 TaxID=2067455 RepID=UPI000C7DB5A4|nr:hypothetical protein [Novosphingobium sp. TH158]PLK26618.1 hypothetical protein C0V78_06760 [Novosphingobium sp. TH158]
MKRLLLTIALPALAGAAAPSTEISCPRAWSDGYAASLGPKVGGGKIWSIHQPVQQTLLGAKVVYAVVEKDTYGWTVHYRTDLKVARGKDAPDKFSKHVEQTYYSRCGESSICMLFTPGVERWLQAVNITTYSAPGRDLTGPGAAMVEADQYGTGPRHVSMTCFYYTKVPPGPGRRFQ